MKTTLFFLLSITFISTGAENISLFFSKESGKVQFAVQEIGTVLKEKGIESTGSGLVRLILF